MATLWINFWCPNGKRVRSQPKKGYTVSPTPRSNCCYSSQQSGQSGWISLSAQDEAMAHAHGGIMASPRGNTPPPLSVLETGARGYGHLFSSSVSSRELKSLTIKQNDARRNSSRDREHDQYWKREHRKSTAPRGRGAAGQVHAPPGRRRWGWPDQTRCSLPPALCDVEMPACSAGLAGAGERRERCAPLHAARSF